ncbi:unnamed protein product [Pleuronectes platessa]|uniref:Uncharacterized protein n=1 Tax=Pleuronectes platessa TaxID=8262 RepID=A0A9N7U3N3_PLEPL|nr:unnamed protein product [Pleuronectes platessa]
MKLIQVFAGGEKHAGVRGVKAVFVDRTVVTWKLFRQPPLTLEARDESCSEEWPRAQASTNAQLNSPGCFKGASLWASKAFYEWEPSWLPTIGCLHTDLFSFLGLKSI